MEHLHGEDGEPIAAIPKGLDGDVELRMSWVRRDGRAPVLSMHIWRRSDDGKWMPMKSGGTFVPAYMLAAFADGVQKAVELARRDRAQQNGSRR